jgi:hypothetical protein
MTALITMTTLVTTHTHMVPHHETTRTTRTFVSRRTTPMATDLVSVDAGHGEEEGSENDGKLGHNDTGCVTEQNIDCFVSNGVRM